MSEISMLIQIIIFFFDSVETPFTWKASITSSSVIFPEDSFLHEHFHDENEPGCSGLGRYFSRPYFLVVVVVVDVFIVIVILLFVTGSGKRYIFTHIFKIELLAPQGRVSSQL